jgi:hypothetical protein
MAWRAALGLVLWWAVGAHAEIFRCEEPGRPVRFTSDPRGCARPVALKPPPERSIGEDAPARPAAARAEPAAAAALDALFPAAPSRAWETLTDRPETPDAEESARGLRASAARHYTRARGAVSEVCTVEVWSFAAPAQAESARAEVAQPTWWGRAAGPQLVLAHGVRLERGRGSRDELSAECAALAEAAHARALATLR